MSNGNIEVNLKYKISSVIIICLFMTMGCISYIFQGLYNGTILFLVMLFMSTATHNCYGVDFRSDAVIIRKIYGKNIKCDIKTISFIELEAPYEELRILGQTRYIRIEKLNGETEKHNIEPIASKKIEKVLIQFCEFHDIPVNLGDDISIDSAHLNKEK